VTEAMLRGWVEPMLGRDIDALVLGCTHYPFIIPLLEKICGPGVRVIDPAPAVARQVGRVLPASLAAPAVARQVGRVLPASLAPPAVARQAGRVLNETGDRGQGSGGQLIYYTSGKPDDFRRALAQLRIEPGEVRGAAWEAGHVIVAGAAPSQGISPSTPSGPRMTGEA
jgi:glutamate racemase